MFPRGSRTKWRRFNTQKQKRTIARKFKMRILTIFMYVGNKYLRLHFQWNKLQTYILTGNLWLQFFLSRLFNHDNDTARFINRNKLYSPRSMIGEKIYIFVIQYKFSHKDFYFDIDNIVNKIKDLKKPHSKIINWVKRSCQ